MANNIIDKIQISGQSYDVKDSSAATVVEVTQQEYDDLPSSAKTGNTLFVITDAEAGDLTQYWTSAQTQSAITQATSGKVDSSSIVTSVSSASTNNEIPTAKAVYDATQSGGGGGKAISAGTNISVTTGETTDTINCTLPIVMKGTNMRINSTSEFRDNLGSCFTFGAFNTVGNGSSCSYLVTFGSDNDMSASSRNREHRYAFGTFLKTQNHCEIAFSKYNVSSSASETFGDSGNTLFSIGNGTSTSARHNAFEIRQNGDIYITSGGTDIKLQDNLGGGGSSINVVQTTGSSTTDVMSQAAVTNIIGDIETLLSNI